MTTPVELSPIFDRWAFDEDLASGESFGVGQSRTDAATTTSGPDDQSAIQFFAHLADARTQQIGASMARSVAPQRDMTGRSWFRITNKAADTAEVYLYDEIGDWGVSAGDFAKELGEVTASNIDLRLNTPGGAVFDGLAIYNALQRHPATITVHVDGLAASIASVIAMAGDRIVIDRYAQMMIHEAHAIACGSTKDMSAMAKLLDEYSDNIAAIYSQRAGGTTQSWRERMRSETWFSAKEAVSAGLADTIAEGAKGRPGNTWDLSIFNYAGRAAAPDPFATGGIVPAPAAVVVDTTETIIPGPAVPVLTEPTVEEAVVAPVVFDPQLFRESMHAAAFDAPAPPPVPARPIDLGPAPPPPEPEPAPAPPIGLTDIFAAAMTLAANDAPAPPTNSPPTNPADEPGFLMNAQAFRAAIKEAVSE